MKKIVITGASSGIGEALALRYAGPDVTLGLVGRDVTRLEGVVIAARARGAKVEAMSMDVADRASMENWLLAFDNDFGGIDLLIANAGVGGGWGLEPTAESLANARSMFATNIDGVLNTIDPVIPRMVARGKGQIAMMGSLAGFRGMPSAPAYAASKGFVKLYGEGLRGAFAPHGIQVSVICPGFVRSRITDQNNFKMPFFLEADEAADIIFKGLDKNKARIAFPWPMLFGVWFFAALPMCVSDWLAQRLPKKS